MPVRDFHAGSPGASLSTGPSEIAEQRRAYSRLMTHPCPDEGTDLRVALTKKSGIDPAGYNEVEPLTRSRRPPSCYLTIAPE
jgi:hypothetical protein